MTKVSSGRQVQGCQPYTSSNMENMAKCLTTRRIKAKIKGSVGGGAGGGAYIKLYQKQVTLNISSHTVESTKISKIRHLSGRLQT